MQTRSFCFVDDLVEGFLRMMATGLEVTGPVNLGNPGEFTMLELAEKVIHLAKSGSQIEQRPLPQDDPQQRKPDIRARQAGSRLGTDGRPRDGRSSALSTVSSGSFRDALSDQRSRFLTRMVDVRGCAR
jgi:hypothetical protein